MRLNYRQLWEQKNGKIPVDEYGRTYEIHHKNGNHDDNSLQNLACLSIEEHYDRHMEQGELGACVMIAKRMMKSPEELRAIQLGGRLKDSTRHKIAESHRLGHASGQIKSWNEGRGGYTLNIDRTGKRYSAKLTEAAVIEIRAEFSVWRAAPTRGTREHAFAKLTHAKYSVSLPTIRNILTGKSWAEGTTWI